jgi:hypothetical protein
VERLPRTVNQAHLGVAISPKMVEEIRLYNQKLAEGSAAYVRGDLNDPVLNQILEELEDYNELEGMGGDYRYLVAPKNKKSRDAGMVMYVDEPRKHDLQQHPLTHKAIAATQRYHEGGGVALVAPPEKEVAVARAKALIQQYVMPGSISKIGGGGERAELPRTAEERADVAASRLVDTDRGYNSVIGYAYGGIPLDAGHVKSYISRPDLANKGTNIAEEIQYANKGKSATEKMAGNQGREATDAELAEGLFKSHKNKLIEGIVLPGNRNSAERIAFMKPIEDKLRGLQALDAAFKVA